MADHTDIRSALTQFVNVLNTYGSLMSAWKRKPSEQTAQAVEQAFNTLDAGCAMMCSVVMGVCSEGVAEIGAWRARQRMMMGDHGGVAGVVASVVKVGDDDN